MAVVMETTLGDLTVDLFVEQRPQACLNFLKLCKIKYYNFSLFHSVQSGFLAQTGDPTGGGSGGESVWGVLEGKEKRYFTAERVPKIRHTDAGMLSMVCTGDSLVGSQFFFTLGANLDSLDSVHCVIGIVTEGHDVLRKLNEVICDEAHRPYRDVRITHTVVLEDPFDDPPRLCVPDRSPSPSVERLAGGRIAPDEEIDETQGKSMNEINELIEEKEAKARATILEIVGDLPDADVAPPENVLFVCKLNPVTTDSDLEIIFSRFGKIVSCEVIRDKKTGDSLQYAFIEFEDQKSCENAYFKMDNVLIDDRRIHVDFSQSVSKIKWLGKGRGVKHFEDQTPGAKKSYDKGRRTSRSREKDDRQRRRSNSRNREEKYRRRSKSRGREDRSRRRSQSRDRDRRTRRDKEDRKRDRDEERGNRRNRKSKSRSPIIARKVLNEEIHKPSRDSQNQNRSDYKNESSDQSKREKETSKTEKETSKREKETSKREKESSKSEKEFSKSEKEASQMRKRENSESLKKKDKKSNGESQPQPSDIDSKEKGLSQYSEKEKKHSRISELKTKHNDSHESHKKVSEIMKSDKDKKSPDVPIKSIDKSEKASINCKHAIEKKSENLRKEKESEHQRSESIINSVKEHAPKLVREDSGREENFFVKSRKLKEHTDTSRRGKESCFLKREKESTDHFVRGDGSTKNMPDENFRPDIKSFSLVENVHRSREDSSLVTRDSRDEERFTDQYRKQNEFHGHRKGESESYDYDRDKEQYTTKTKHLQDTREERRLSEQHRRDLSDSSKRDENPHRISRREKELYDQSKGRRDPPEISRREGLVENSLKEHEMFSDRCSQSFENRRRERKSSDHSRGQSENSRRGLEYVENSREESRYDKHPRNDFEYSENARGEKWPSEHSNRGFEYALNSRGDRDVVPHSRWDPEYLEVAREGRPAEPSRLHVEYSENSKIERVPYPRSRWDTEYSENSREPIAHSVSHLEYLENDRGKRESLERTGQDWKYTENLRDQRESSRRDLEYSENTRGDMVPTEYPRREVEYFKNSRDQRVPIDHPRRDLERVENPRHEIPPEHFMGNVEYFENSIEGKQFTDQQRLHKQSFEHLKRHRESSDHSRTERLLPESPGREREYFQNLREENITFSDRSRNQRALIDHPEGNLEPSDIPARDRIPLGRSRSEMERYESHRDDEPSSSEQRKHQKVKSTSDRSRREKIHLDQCRKESESFENHGADQRMEENKSKSFHQSSRIGNEIVAPSRKHKECSDFSKRVQDPTDYRRRDNEDISKLRGENILIETSEVKHKYIDKNISKQAENRSIHSHKDRRDSTHRPLVKSQNTSIDQQMRKSSRDEGSLDPNFNGHIEQKQPQKKRADPPHKDSRSTTKLHENPSTKPDKKKSKHLKVVEASSEKQPKAEQKKINEKETKDKKNKLGQKRKKVVKQKKKLVKKKRKESTSSSSSDSSNLSSSSSSESSSSESDQNKSAKGKRRKRKSSSSSSSSSESSSSSSTSDTNSSSESTSSSSDSADSNKEVKKKVKIVKKKKQTATTKTKKKS